MLKPNSYQHICRTFDEIPEEMFSRLRREIGEALGQSVGTIFPAFAQAFPLTAEAMEVHWPKPIAAFERGRKFWLCFLLMERSDLNLYFDLRAVSDPLEGLDYDQEHAMLPPAWRELYRWFESFVVTEKSIQPLSWINTPSSYSGRLPLEEYRQQLDIGKSKARDFAKAIGSDQLMCWLRTDAGDALFLDEKHCDHKVYHVRGTALEDVYVLPDPAGTLDRYLAHYLSGKSPEQFDFRA